MKIKIKAKNEKTIKILKKYGKMKQRGVNNIFDEENQTLIMGFPKLRNKETLIPSYNVFIEKTLTDEGLTKQLDYEVLIE